MEEKLEDKVEEKKDYEFVTETIKKKPLNKRKAIQRIAYSVGFGMLAGFVACIVFALLAPRLYTKINPPEIPEDTVPITIPKDNNITEEENVSQTEASAANTASGIGMSEISNNKNDNDVVENTDDANSDASDNNSDPDNENNSDLNNADNNSDENKQDDGTVSENPNATERDEDEDIPEDVPIVQEIVEKNLEVEDYKNLFVKFKEVNYEASKSLATVTLVSDNTDWFMNNYETGNKFTGIILADNGRELLIIANIDKLNNKDAVDVTFCDGTVYKGKIKKSDSNTGLSVVAVNLNTIEDSTKNSIKMAELGNSYISSLVGTPVMAIGAPLGIDGSMQLGLVTSSNHVLEYPDSNLRYLTTDMYGSTDGSGIIIDLDGKVVGIIFHNNKTNADSRNLIRAYGISDIKAKIEKISNGQDLAYLGIIGTDVTKEAVESLGVPEGAYVKQVIVDSPAMRGGIRNGDVIVKFGTTEITRFSDFKDAMLKSQPGDSTVITVKRPGKDAYVEFSYEISLEALQ